MMRDCAERNFDRRSSCALVLAVAVAASPALGGPAVDTPQTPIEPGSGFTVASSDVGELRLSAYLLVRYLNQFPAEQELTDHLGRVTPIDTRQDFNLHRAMVHFLGWIYAEKFRYHATIWTVNATEQVRIVGSLSYRFDPKLNVYAGIRGLPGSRSLTGSHPFWQGHDRIMADEFFRPGFTAGAWVEGEVVPRLNYTVMLGNNLSQLGINALKLTRDIATGVTVWWMPTTGEFGPQGGYRDYEMHERVATRLGISGTHSREDRFNNVGAPAPDNTQVRMADSTLFFETGALAPSATVQKADFWLLALDAGLKYQGMFLQAEYYFRSLDNFEVSGGDVPVDSLFDHGFYVQAGVFPIPKRLHVYGGMSWVFGDDSAGFDNAFDLVAGASLFPFDTPNHRLTMQAVAVDRAAASSTFGYYTGGLQGITLTLEGSVLF